ncbi:MAG: ACP S-malonyltransferase [Nitriliruptoraceae bacterium]
MRVAAVFPGQGSHRAGCLDPWIGDDAFEIADRISSRIGRDVVALARSPETGGRTADAQPVIFATSMVALTALARADVSFDVVAGHSLGEYSAAVAAGSVNMEDAAALVDERGRAMGQACAQNPGTLAAVVKLEPDQVDAIVREAPGVVIANDNAVGQVVVAGTPAAIDELRGRVRDAGGRVLPLDVEGAFHSPAMEPAVASVATAVGALAFDDPSTPLITGTTAEVLTRGHQVASALVDGMLAPVRWRLVQDRMIDIGVTDVIEVGPGGVLVGMAKRSMPGVRRHRVENPEDVATVAAVLAAAHATGEVS